MPRYFFNVGDSRKKGDGEGVVLKNLNEARAQAIKTAGEILVAEGTSFWVKGRWGITVVNAAGATV